MGIHVDFSRAAPMASPWRRRPLCRLVGEVGEAPAALRRVSAAGASLDTDLRPRLGSRVALHHPEAGRIEGVVRGLAVDGVTLAFDPGATAIGFALTAIAADMTRPG